ncbi:MAG TPA: hypothetical protein VNN25_02705 [Thermoanaerobaculia bacterium]|nr:hypothetical protein [Thermoanaerobaculia bacterium]
MKKTWAGWLSLGAGVFWQATGTAHHLEYLKKIIVDRLDVAAIGSFVVQSPAIMVIALSCGWLIYVKQHSSHEDAVQNPEMVHCVPSPTRTIPPAREANPHPDFEMPQHPQIAHNCDEIEVTERIILERKVVYRAAKSIR